MPVFREATGHSVDASVHLEVSTVSGPAEGIETRARILQLPR